MLRDILQFDSSVAESVARIQNAARTANLILAVGDGKPGVADTDRYRAFAYSGSKVTVYDDTNLEPYNTTWVSGFVFLDDGYVPRVGAPPPPPRLLNGC